MATNYVLFIVTVPNDQQTETNSLESTVRDYFDIVNEHMCSPLYISRVYYLRYVLV